MKQKSTRSPQSAGSVLGSVLRGMGLTQALSRHAVVTHWAEIVDESVARHAKAEKVTGSTLHVAVDSSVWMNELAALKKVLLEKVNSSLPAGAAPIEDMRFSQRSWARSSEHIQDEPTPPAPDERDIRAARTVLEPIRDDKLKHLLNRILEKDRQLKWRRTSGK